MRNAVVRRVVVGTLTLAVPILVAMVVVPRIAAAPKARSGPLPGDLNLDGIVDLKDLKPFLQALKDANGWIAEHHASQAQLLAVGDFDHDGQFTVEDRVGFAAALRPPTVSQVQKKVLASARTASVRTVFPAATIDLDSDSDNNNDNGLPRRTDAEDTLEASAPGKFILLNSDDDDGNGIVDKDQTSTVTGEDETVPVVLEIAPDPSVPRVTSVIAYRYNYDSGLRLWRSALRGDPSDPNAVIGSGVSLTQRVWVLGDTNVDGVVDANDVDPYILLSSNPQQYTAQYLGSYPDMAARVGDIADFSGDRSVNWRDTDGFVAALDPNAVARYVAVYAWVEAIGPSLGSAQVTGQADTNNDTNIDGSDAVGDQDYFTIDIPAAGAAPEWGAGLGVSPFSSVNLRNGNVLTVIPITGFDPAGPPVQFALYHNSISRAIASPTASQFGLGRGWSTSYSGYINGSVGSSVTVVSDDGTRTAYRYESSTGTYAPPAGVHDILTWDPNAYHWTLTSPSQWKNVYNVNGTLTGVYDEAGRGITIDRSSTHINYIASAVDGQTGVGNHRITFTYNVAGRLDTVTDPAGRQWSFDCGTSGTPLLTKINWAHDEWVDESDIRFTYDTSDTNGRISSIKSRDLKNGIAPDPNDPNYQKLWTYEYVNGRLWRVTDPAPDANTTPYQQTLAYSPWYGNRRTVYTDRRGQNWTYVFDPAGNLMSTTNPLSQGQSWGHDADHNVTSATNALGQSWTYTYGAGGTLLTATSPLMDEEYENYLQTWRVFWVDPPAGMPNLRRVARVCGPTHNPTDPNQFVVQYAYDPSNPTHVVTITEPSTATLGAATTTLEYYEPNDVVAQRGQLKLVTDANGVEHRYQYDKWGYLAGLAEGDTSETRSMAVGTFQSNPEADAIGRLIGNRPGDSTGVCYSDGSGVDNGSDLRPDVNGNPHELCYIIVYKYQGGGCPLRLGSLPPGMDVFNVFEGWGSSTSERDVVGRLLSAGAEFGMHAYDAYTTTARSSSVAYTYDDLGRPTTQTVTRGGRDVYSVTNVWAVPRSFGFTYGDAAGPTTITSPGPDATITYDALGRVSTVVRSGMGVVYHYDAAGRAEQQDNTDGTNVKSSVVRTWDDAGRLTSVEHRGDSNNVLLNIAYTWNLDNTVATRTETDYTVSPTQAAVVTFGYDARNRLTSESRVVGTTTVYAYTYAYDQLGNRRQKDEGENGLQTKYVYDTDYVSGAWSASAAYAPTWTPEYVTRNNRLLEYKVYGPVVNNTRALLRTVHYTYFVTGHVSNITVKDEPPAGAGGATGGSEEPTAYDWYYDLALFYSVNGELRHAVWTKWRPYGTAQFEYFTHLARRDFLYDSPRALYGVESFRWDGTQLSPWQRAGLGEWTDYVGDQPWGTYQFSAYLEQGQANYTEEGPYETGRLLAGAGVHAQQDVDPDGGGPGVPAVTGTKYLHGDLTRSTMLLTDQYSDAVSPTGCRAVVGYTAFGEPVVQTSATPSATLLGGDLPAGFVRFGYDGGWGYQAGLNVAAPSTEADDPLRGTGLLSLYGPRADLPPIALQHVGARWYDPGLGRFVQRDPIGIEGGLNVYAYTANNPVVSVDPEGEYWILLVIAGIAVLLFVKGCANGCNSGTRGANMPRREVLGPKSDTVPDWKTAGGSFGSDDMNEMCVAYRDAASNVPGSGLTGPPMTPDAPGFIVQIWNALINWWNSW